ncbi:site-specific DNA-methyltransferase [Marinobacter confluentis]|uniref:site-specific DNA-methyltransferase (adenine-specific) n=1 Tax=Marinobacter confluentis TaxID=1697557 RepID=A0A4Z1C117_9GAMM|nr:site-specific DNA-methyltransferase [Marinobacter confluentis]TGN39791.1 site-specific DNA-methyltransferase [Marinobacter confluentis]
MPTLEFKGKQFVYSHHLGVPFRELKVISDKSFPAKGQEPSLDDNLIIHGDNLEALKALLPTHAGKVDCIFIDPPYNTGNEGWCYNDNVRSPLMREWLKKSANPVDKEDLERHDKWLCMMWPRLNLLRELLSEKGAIVITLDDNEIHRLRGVMDEVFGEDNFVATSLWQKNYSPKNTAEFFSSDHDYVLIYAKNKSTLEMGSLDRTEAQEGRYKNLDNDPRGPWKTSDLSARNPYSEGTYPLETPSGRKIDGPPRGNYWRVSKAKFDELDSDGRIWWGKDGSSIPQIKRFLSDIRAGRVPQTLWFYSDVGHTDEAKKEIKQILDFETTADVFVTPKPTRLVERVLQLFTANDSVVLDSFAGSATTAHAVLEANKKDDGNRRFILVECEDYADTLTAERMRRVINGYPYTGTQRDELHRENITWSTFEKKHSKVLEHVASIENLQGHEYDKISKQIKDGVLTVTGERKVKGTAPGLGGSFTYCTLGEPIDIESLLTGTGLPTFEALARYVFYTATGQSLAKVGEPAPDGFIGETDLFRVHLFYQPDREWLRSNEAALNAERVSAIEQSSKSGKRAIVFAVAKFMSQKELTARRIEFCQLPYAVHRILGD